MSWKKNFVLMKGNSFETFQLVSHATSTQSTNSSVSSLRSPLCHIRKPLLRTEGFSRDQQPHERWGKKKSERWGREWVKVLVAKCTSGNQKDDKFYVASSNISNKGKRKEERKKWSQEVLVGGASGAGSTCMVQDARKTAAYYHLLPNVIFLKRWHDH